MDFLDPKKRRNYKIRLIVGYVLIGIAVVMATTILLYQARGFGVDKEGKVIQNGLVFVSSQPSGADIFVDGVQQKSQTDTRVQLPAGQHALEVRRDGYRTWRREVAVNGGDVQRFDYPLLIPTKLTTSAVKQYATDPHLMTQSLDRKWLLVQNAVAFGEFELYNLAKPKDAATAFALAPEVLTPGDGAQGWEVVEWSKDNRHVLLKHLYQRGGQPASEYILLDRQAPLQSLNLSKALNVNPTRIALRDQVYDKYYLFDQAAATLSQASLETPAAVPYLDHVLDFTPYGSDVVLYVSDQATVPGKVSVRLRQGADSFNLRELKSSAYYLLDLTRYSGDWYMAVGSSDEEKVYLYRNPLDTLKDKPKGPAVAWRVLRITAPTYVQFSDNGRFVMAQGGAQFAVYDAEYKQNYSYKIQTPLDAPQQHASWMDSHRLQFVSDNKTIIFDYDGVNQQTLAPADPRFGAVFDPDFKAAYSFAPVTTLATADKPAVSGFALTSTALRTPKDQ